jgi:hypothetical protein
MDNGNLYILNALNSLLDSTQDFTDCLYISNEQRERIIRLQNDIREQTLIYLKEEIMTKQQEQQEIDSNNNQNNNKSSNENENENDNPANNNNNDNKMNASINRLLKATPILNDCEILKKLLQNQTMQLGNFFLF